MKNLRPFIQGPLEMGLRLSIAALLLVFSYKIMGWPKGDELMVVVSGLMGAFAWFNFYQTEYKTVNEGLRALYFSLIACVFIAEAYVQTLTTPVALVILGIMIYAAQRHDPALGPYERPIMAARIVLIAGICIMFLGYQFREQHWPYGLLIIVIGLVIMATGVMLGMQKEMRNNAPPTPEEQA